MTTQKRNYHTDALTFFIYFYFKPLQRCSCFLRTLAVLARFQRNGIGVACGERMECQCVGLLEVLKFNYPIFSKSLRGITWPTSFVWQSLKPGYSSGTIGTRLENPYPVSTLTFLPSLRNHKQKV